MIYADYNATTPLSAQSAEAIRGALEIWGNPSSTHQLGRKVLSCIHDARDIIASKLNVKPSEVVFTSGGSEANTLAILGSYLKIGSDFRLLTSKVEHSSIRDTVKLLMTKGAKVEFVSLTKTGELVWDDFVQKVKHFKPHLISLMAANNETGVKFNISAVREVCGAIPIHTDAVQAFGKIPCSEFSAANLISISSHKIYGPKGVGALIVKGDYSLIPIHYGGSQEIKRRGGTENTIGIIGFGAACALLGDKKDLEKLKVLQQNFEESLLKNLEEIEINGLGADRIPNTSNIRFKGISSEVLLSALDLDGICVSAGSACSSGSISPSHVLLEMGLKESEAKECLRISWGTLTSLNEVECVVNAIIKHVKRIRARKEQNA